MENYDFLDSVDSDPISTPDIEEAAILAKRDMLLGKSNSENIERVLGSAEVTAVWLVNQSQIPKNDWEDVIQECLLTASKCIKRFNPRKARFKTYCIYSMRMRILRYIARQSKLDRLVRIIPFSRWASSNEVDIGESLARVVPEENSVDEDEVRHAKELMAYLEENLTSDEFDIVCDILLQKPVASILWRAHITRYHLYKVRDKAKRLMTTYRGMLEVKSGKV